MEFNDFSKSIELYNNNQNSVLEHSYNKNKNKKNAFVYLQLIPVLTPKPR